ncbi:class I SAM-dependent methyltransferase [Sulfobacillus thermosulfidooxidans]|uniref:class I SAM-dependent methyltransferase n=1 Tax=Sulfobacillus thermosulfidooxidans TaxID=28034 RepID=UPI0002DA6E33|nr:class I SAM-dependent methyltransferase [Sulfobacillus thermosulfidooxidans]
MNFNELPAETQQRLQYWQEQIEPIQGWCSFAAGVTLYHLVQNNIPVPVVVELGSWKGRSTAWMAAALADQNSAGKIICVDTWRGTPSEKEHAQLLANYHPDQLFEEFLHNMEHLGLRDWIVPLRMTTIEGAKAWPSEQPIGLLFIDADHDYYAVRRDFELWSGYVKEGGLIVFDDVPNWPGPTRLISELPSWWKHVGYSDNQWIVIKTA